MNLAKTSIGIELGSTRIKAVLIDENTKVLASGFFDWENQLVNGIWTYSMDDIHNGIRKCFSDLKKDYKEKYNESLDKTGCIGISGMMHGYLAFDKNDNLLVPFRTWRNTITEQASDILTELFNFNIPQRWSIAHLYQAILNNEEHVKDIAYITTLAGYIHYKLTGQKVVGIGEASGMFPIDSKTLDYNVEMLDKFDTLIKDKNFKWKLADILPKVLVAGENAGHLCKEGIEFIDIDKNFLQNIPMCPPEGDAGTGMVATNSIKVNTGNVSAGTSDFAMIVIDKDINVHKEIDMVTTPCGSNVAMVHCNNCTSDINAWVSMFNEVVELFGNVVDKNTLYTKLFEIALKGEKDCGGLLSYNYYSGEGVTFLNEGRPVFTRTPNSKLSLANFMRTHLLSALATLKIGLDILTKKEHVTIEKIYGHGGFFKTPVVGQTMLSAAIDVPVSVNASASEGGPYGMALLANYCLYKDKYQTLEEYLDNVVFKDCKITTIKATKKDVAGFNKFLRQYKKSLAIEKAAIKTIKVGD